MPCIWSTNPVTGGRNRDDMKSLGSSPAQHYPPLPDSSNCARMLLASPAFWTAEAQPGRGEHTGCCILSFAPQLHKHSGFCPSAPDAILPAEWLREPINAAVVLGADNDSITWDCESPSPGYLVTPDLRPSSSAQHAQPSTWNQWALRLLVSG